MKKNNSSSIVPSRRALSWAPATLAVVLALAAGASRTQAGTHVWSGAVNGYWSNAGNWSAGGAPSVGEAAPVILNFPNGATRHQTTNDIGSIFFGSLVVDQINLTGANFVLAGKGGGTYLYLSGYFNFPNVLENVYCTGLSNVFDNSLQLILQKTNSFYVNPGITLALKSLIAGPGGMTFFGPGNAIIGGSQTNTFTGALNVQSGNVYLDGYATYYDDSYNVQYASGVTAIGGPLIIGLTSNSTPANLYVQRNNQFTTNCDITVNPTGTLRFDNSILDENMSFYDYFPAYYDYGLENTARSVTLNGGAIYLGWARYVYFLSYYYIDFANHYSQFNVLSNLVSNLSPNPTTTSMIYGPGILQLLGCNSTITADQMLLYSSSYGINKFGPGTLTMLGSNTTDGLTISQGPARVISPDVYLKDSVTISNGGQLTVQKPIQMFGNLFLAGRGTNNNGAALVIQSSNVNFKVYNSVSVGSNATINVVSPTDEINFYGVNYDSHLAGTNNFYKIGAGTLRFSDFNGNLTNQFFMGVGLSNIFSGTAFIQQGTVECNSKDPGPAGWGIYPRDFGMTFNGPIVIGTNGSTASTYLNLYGSQQFGSNSVVTINDGGALNLGTNKQSIGSLALNGGFVAFGTLELLGDVTAQNGLASPFLWSTVSLGGTNRTFNVANNSTLGVYGPIVDGGASAGVIKTGAGELDLWVTNSYGGLTAVNAGKLGLVNQGTPGSTNSGTVIAAGAELDLKDGGQIGKEALSLNGYGTDGKGALKGTGTNSWAGPVTLASNTSINVSNNSRTELSGVIGGAFDLDKTGVGILFLDGNQPNTYSGLTTVVQGQLSLSKTNGPAIPGPLVAGDEMSAWGAHVVRVLTAGQLASNAPVTLHLSSLLDLSGTFNAAQKVGSLEGRGAVALGLNNSITVANSADARFDGKFTGFGPSSLVKQGAGKWTLGGMNDQFQGGIFVNAGTLDAANWLPASLLTVNTGARLMGGGLVGNVTSAGGTISPGCCPGLMRLDSKNLSLNATSIFRAQLDGAGASPGGTAFSQIRVTGAIDLGGATLLATLGFNSAVSNRFTLIDNDGADAVAGTFAGLPEGATLTVGAAQMQITYQGGDGNDVVLTQTGKTAPPQFGGITRLGNGTVQLSGAGLPGQTYTVQGNFDLNTTNWLTVGSATATMPAGLLQFIDLDAPNHPMRFYRFVLP